MLLHHETVAESVTADTLPGIIVIFQQYFVETQRWHAVFYWL